MAPNREIFRILDKTGGNRLKKTLQVEVNQTFQTEDFLLIGKEKSD